MVYVRRPLSGTTLHTNFKEAIEISSSGTLSYIKPVGKRGMKHRLKVKTGVSLTVNTSGNIRMPGSFVMNDPNDILEVESDGAYWVHLNRSSA